MQIVVNLVFYDLKAPREGSGNIHVVFLGLTVIPAAASP